MKQKIIDIFLICLLAACGIFYHDLAKAGGFGGASYSASQIQGTMQLNQGGTGISVITSANAGKYLRLGIGATTAVWDGVNNYAPVSMVSNAASISIDDTGNYIFRVTGALTAPGNINATFTVPADPTYVIFDNRVTGGFALTVAGTYNIPLGISQWYWDGSALVLIGSNSSSTVLTTINSVDYTIPTASSYSNILGVAQGSGGTWLVTINITLYVSTACTPSWRISDGTTVSASGQMSLSTNGSAASYTFSTIVVNPSGNIILQMTGGGVTNLVVKFNTTGNATDSTIRVIRLY
jgi:hypothetical protein